MKALTLGLTPGRLGQFSLGAFRAARKTAALSAAVVLTLAGGAYADVADFIPQDAVMVFKARNAQQVSDNIAALAREWGLDQFEPAFADPLGEFQRETGMSEGINFDSDAGLYFANGDLDAPTPPVVILVPVSDFEAFLGNFQDVQEEDGVHVAQMNASGNPAYIAHWGDYAAMSPLKDLVTDQPEQTIEFNGPTGERLEERDLTFYANFRTLGPKFLQQLQESGVRQQAIDEISANFDQEVPEGLRKYQSVVIAAVNQGFDIAEQFLQQAEATTISLTIDPEAGIGADAVAQFEADSYFANTFGNLATADDSLLSGLPEGTYLAFGGSVGDPEAGTRMFDDLVGPIVQELQQVDDEGLLTDYIDSLRQIIAATESSRYGLFAPVGGMGGGPLIQQVNIYGGDAEQIREATRGMVDTLPRLMQQFAAAADVPQDQMPPVNVDYTEEAKNVAGVSFARLSTEMPQDDPTQAMIMNMVFGPEGQTQYLATIEDNFVSVSGLTDQQITTVVEAVQADESPMANAAGVEMVNDNLPENRSAVMYFQVAEFARTGLGFAQAFGQAPPVQIPENLPPVGMMVGPEENAIQAAAFIPKDLVSAMIVTALQFQQGMGAGGQGGGL